MNKTTDELMNLLMSKEDLPQYIEENSNEFLQSSLCQYLNQLQTEHSLKKGDIIADALEERSYGYQIFSGRKEMPSRDVLISFALAMKLSLDETQSLLRNLNKKCQWGLLTVCGWRWPACWCRTSSTTSAPPF